MKELKIFVYMHLQYKTGSHYWVDLGAVFCAGDALGGTRQARFHSILLPLGSIMSLTNVFLLLAKRTISGK